MRSDSLLSTNALADTRSLRYLRRPNHPARKRGIPRLFSLLVLVSCSAISASAPPWYEQTTFACSDPLNLTTVFAQSTWFTTALNLKAVAVSQGLVYVTVSKSDFDRYSAATDHSGVVEEITLSPQIADTLRQVLKSRQQDAKVPPLAAAALTAIPSYFTTWAGGLVLGQVFGLIFSKLDEIAVATGTLREFIATGGVLSKVVTAGTRDSSEYLIYSYVYTVKVGEEKRAYLLSSCVYAAKTLFKEIDTVGTLNNKRLMFIGNDSWRVFDVDGNKFDPGNWTETSRDKEYVYLESTSAGGLTGRWRVSLHGGKWQTQHQDGTWGTLYLTTTSS